MGKRTILVLFILIIDIFLIFLLLEHDIEKIFIIAGLFISVLLILVIKPSKLVDELYEIPLFAKYAKKTRSFLHHLHHSKFYFYCFTFRYILLMVFILAVILTALFLQFRMYSGEEKPDSIINEISNQINFLKGDTIEKKNSF